MIFSVDYEHRDLLYFDITKMFILFNEQPIDIIRNNKIELLILTII
jgi:hypothetical protein